MDNFNKKKINPNDFIQKYNKQFNKSFVFPNDMKKKKVVSIKSLIACFIPILHKDWMKVKKNDVKTKKGGTSLDPPATDTITNAVQRDNQNNFFNYFPRNPPFTSVYNGADLTPNQVGNEFPPISNYSRANF